MSAMHWEARRRQRALDRRTARDHQQLLLRGSETGCQATGPTPEASAGSQCPHCKDNLETPTPHGAKLPNRYSSLQYNQQW